MRPPFRNFANIGDEVTFTGRRGAKVTGIIGAFHTKQRRGRARQVAEAVTGDPTSLDRECFRVYVPGQDIVYTVPCGSVTRTKRHAVTQREAKNTLDQILSGIRGTNNATNRRHKQTRSGIASDRGLLNLTYNAKLFIRYRGGSVKPCYFRGFTDSGRVKFAGDPFGKPRFGEPAQFSLTREGFDDDQE